VVTDAKVMQVQEIVCLTAVPFPVPRMLCRRCAFTCETLWQMPEPSGWLCWKV